MRGEWIEIYQGKVLGSETFTSLPMRGEWIEILELLVVMPAINVSPHAGRVD